MDLKEFLRPTIAKVTLFIILFAITSAIPNILFYGFDIGVNYGFPFRFYGYGDGPLPSWIPISSYFAIDFFILDILVWYLVSCGVVALYKKT